VSSTAILVAICGPPLSGKSALLQAIQKEAPLAPCLFCDVDDVRLALAPGSQPELAMRDLGYRGLHLLAKTALRSDVSAVLVATYIRAEKRAELVQVGLPEGHTRCLIVQCVVTPEVAAFRFANRSPSHPAQDLTEALVRRYAAQYPYLKTAPILDSTTLSVPQMVAQFMEIMNEQAFVELDSWASAAAG
jgi:predicted kinase